MSDDKHLLEETVDSEEVFKGALLHVFRDQARLPHGGTSTREWIKHPGASAVLPVFDNGDVLLIRQFRYPCGQVFLEVPAGKIDPGETPEQTAAREIEEEAGVVYHAHQALSHCYPAIGYSDEIIYLYVGWDLEETAQAIDEDEFVERVRMPFAQAVDLALNGGIADVKTALTLLRAAHWWRRQGPFAVDGL